MASTESVRIVFEVIIEMLGIRGGSRHADI